MNLVFTGKFQIDGEHIVRQHLVDVCRARKWNVDKAVTWDTDFLVQAVSGGHGTTKSRKAEQLGVNILSEEMFWKMAKEAPTFD